MQWKPIVYCSEERGKLGTNAHMSYSTNVTNTTELQGTMLDSFYGNQLNAMLVRRINVTFGKFPLTAEILKRRLQFIT